MCKTLQMQDVYFCLVILQHFHDKIKNFPLKGKRRQKPNKTYLRIFVSEEHKRKSPKILYVPVSALSQPLCIWEEENKQEVPHK